MDFENENIDEIKIIKKYLQLFMCDDKNKLCKRMYAEIVYYWIDFIKIEELFKKSYEKSMFILDVLEKYKPDGYDEIIKILNYHKSKTKIH